MSLDGQERRWQLQQASPRGPQFRQSSSQFTLRRPTRRWRARWRISFIDVAWLVEGVDAGDVVNKLDRCARANLDWAQDNVAHFETAKTEAVLFSRRHKHRQCQAAIRVGGRFAPEATCWLGIWLWLGPYFPGKPATPHWQGSPGRGQDPPYRQSVWRPPNGNA